MEIVIIIILVILNGVFSMSEIALVSVRKSRLESDMKKGSKSAKAALHLAEEPNKFLSTVQIGITLVGILTGLYSGEAFSNDLAKVIAHNDFLKPYSHEIATISIVFLVTYLTIVFGELIPKRLGLSMAERISKAVAKPMSILSIIMTPMVWLLSKSTTVALHIFGVKGNEAKITEEEIKILVKEAVDTGEVQEVEHNIVERVFNLGDRDVNSIMTYRSDIISFDATDTRETIRQKVMENMHDVYPVIANKFEDLLGVVYISDLFGQIEASDFSLKNIIREAQFLPQNMSVYKVLESFKQTSCKYGLITDEFGCIEGMVTLTDIMEALVGEITEEGEEKDIIVRTDGSLLVDGQCSFYKLLEYLDMQELYPESDYNTLSGLILELLEHIPREGEKVVWHNLAFEIVDMDGARIDKVLVDLKNHLK